MAVHSPGETLVNDKSLVDTYHSNLFNSDLKNKLVILAGKSKHLEQSQVPLLTCASISNLTPMI
jgi:hypothetical protein